MVVTYRPNLALLRQALAQCRRQVGGTVVFDNASAASTFDALADVLDGTEVLRSPVNIGLAAALNRGIDRARERGFRYVLLLDQDSVPAEGMVRALRTELERLRANGVPAGAVGPQALDARNGLPAPFVRVGFPFNRKIPGGPGQCIECDFLISSGCLIPLDVLDQAGAMDEGLFIDNVDLEWCFRVRAAGMKLYGICDARMQHAIGDALRPSRVRRGGVFVHRPLRLYYIMRNRVLLYRRRHTPWAWIGQDLLRLPMKFCSTVLFQPPRREYLRCMLRGLRDGLRGVVGPARSD
ncbi:MAG: glycosyltransferase family 2 protein [Pseudoxanthomonas sp.]